MKSVFFGLTFVIIAERFHLIKRASEILLDAIKRHTYDDMVRTRLLRKKRDAEAADDIRAMKSDLKAREAEALLANRPKVDVTKKAREETATYRMERAAKKAEEERHKEALRATLPASFHITAVMLKWDPNVHTYSEGDISQIVKPFGSVEATILPKSGGAATIICSSESSANAIVTQLSPSTPLGSKLGFTNVYLNQSTAPGLQSPSSTPSPTLITAHSPSPHKKKSSKTSLKSQSTHTDTTHAKTSTQTATHQNAPSTTVYHPLNSNSSSNSHTTSFHATTATTSHGDETHTSSEKPVGADLNDDDFEDMVLAKMKEAKRNKVS